MSNTYEQPNVINYIDDIVTMAISLLEARGIGVKTEGQEMVGGPHPGTAPGWTLERLEDFIGVDLRSQHG